MNYDWTLKKGVFLSKQVLRDYYEGSSFQSNPDLYAPRRLPQEALDVAKEMYQALLEKMKNPQSSSLDRWIKKFHEYQGEHEVYVIGDGGREHALASKLAESPLKKYGLKQRKLIFFKI